MGWVKRMLLAIALLVPGVANAGNTADLGALVTANRWPVVAGPAGLGGPGGERIVGWASGAQFFLLGENHGNIGMARFSTSLSRSLAGQGYGYTAVEVDPLMTRLLVEQLRGGGKPGLAAWLAADQRQRSIPFYVWDEEADFILSSMARGPVWGLDESFIAASHIHLDEIARLTRSAKARAMATAMAAEARANVTGFLGKVDMTRLTALRTAMTKGDPAIPLTEQLIESTVIYAPFTRDDGGSGYAANLRRETMMKMNFIANLKAVTKGGAVPKVLLKFGSNHLARGLSPTHVPSLGSFVAETALGMGTSAFNLRLVCGPGTQQTLFDASSYDCEADEFTSLAAALKPWLLGSGDTLIDLRPLRDHPGLWKEWPEDAKSLVWSYDAVVVIGASGGSHFLAPLPKM